MKTQKRQMRVIAVVPAAGLGKRFGKDANKPFLPLGGRPLIIRSLEVLESIPEIAEIIPALKPGDMEQGQKVFEEYGLKKIKKIAPGGIERQDSVYSCLKLIEDKESIVVIHDGVRPLVERNLIEAALKELRQDATKDQGGLDGVVLAVPVKDTIKEVREMFISRTLKRESIMAIQTPQIFPYEVISRAYYRAMEEGLYSTDDSALVERYGGKVKVVMGSYRNIKITTPEDLVIAEAFLRDSATG
jgi:2-C-methyl-D-erythritol 4-phosphate cytidylyltransferase